MIIREAKHYRFPLGPKDPHGTGTSPFGGVNVFDRLENGTERCNVEDSDSVLTTQITRIVTRALVLNSSCQPLKMVSWQKALLLWFQGKVEILEYQETMVCSVSRSFQIPSVMRLKRYVTPRKTTRLKFSRENIYLRDNYTCQYCAQSFSPKHLTLDHVVPASKFGRKDWSNVVTACRDCNHKKANRTPLGAGMPLLSEPKIPNWLPVVQPQFELENMPEEWRPYLRTG